MIYGSDSGPSWSPYGSSIPSNGSSARTYQSTAANADTIRDEGFRGPPRMGGVKRDPGGGSSFNPFTHEGQVD